MIRLRQMLESWIDEHAEITDVDVLAHALKQLRDLKRTLAVLDDDLSDRIAENMDGKWYEVGGLGMVEVKRSTPRKTWDHDRLTARVVACALDERVLDEETGVYEREADAVARALRDCAGINYWKLTGLRKRGIDPQDYSESGNSRVSVVLP